MKSIPQCSHEGCEKPHKARGLCDLHYNKTRRKGGLSPLPEKVSLLGQRFGMLLVIGETWLPPGWNSNSTHRHLWVAKCDCGKWCEVRGIDLTRGERKSCGCYNHLRTHGKTKTPEFTAWQRMFGRCYNRNEKGWLDYGGRGISVCERWRSFESFLADMGERPEPDHSLDRINNDGNYEPGNCRWATKREQRMNQRPRRYRSKMYLVNR